MNLNLTNYGKIFLSSLVIYVGGCTYYSISEDHITNEFSINKEVTKGDTSTSQDKTNPAPLVDDDPILDVEPIDLIIPTLPDLSE